MIANFFFVLSTVAPPMSDILKMPWWEFLAAETVGSLVWAGSFYGLRLPFHSKLEHAA